MYLTDDEKKMRDGHLGEAVSMAMSILVDLGEAIDAPEMVEITHVHTDSGFYLGDAGLEFVEHLVALGGQVAVPTSMNNTSFDIERCRSYGVSAELAGKIKRLEKAHLAMGALPSWTCAPYQDGILPKPGDRVAWSAAAPLVLLELAKQATAPAAIINIETDPLLVAGPIISKHFYGTSTPVVALTRAAFDRLQTGQTAAVDGVKGEIVIGHR